MSSPLRARRALLAAGFVLVAVEALAGVPASSQVKVASGPLPRAVCGPGSHPETGMQGRIPPADIANGRAAAGYDCNVQVVGRHISGNAGWKVARFGDCAYYNADPGGVPLGLLTATVPGTHVVDVSNPAKPVQTDFLRLPASASPHESMAIDKKRGLLVLTFTNLASSPAVLEIWDVKTDCRRPRLVSTWGTPLLGHEGNLSADGLTYYAGSLYFQTLTAVDISDPTVPKLLAVANVQSHGMSTSPDGTRLYDTIRGDENAGLVIFDTTDIQKRVPGASFKQISRLGWPEKSTPQFAIPVTIKGKPYLIETDEFGGPSATGGGPIGAARIIDLANEKAPAVVSNLRLEVHQPEAQPKFAADGDVVPLLGSAYTGHYCSVPREVDPEILACSMLRSGLRIFDIRDPRKPREVAYYNPPAAQDLIDGSGGSARLHVGSNVEFVPERREIWVGVQDSGLHIIRLTNGVWPAGRRRAKEAPTLAAPARPVTPNPLPATGLPTGVGLATGLALVLAGSAMTRSANRRARRSHQAAGA